MAELHEPDPTRPVAAPQASGPVTLDDIARECRLSKGSVSRALSMTMEACPLSAQTWERVHRVSRQMGYRVNTQARALASGRAMAIGLVYEGVFPVFESVYQRMVEAFAGRLHEQGYHLALLALDHTDRWEDSLLGGLVDGCVCLHSFPQRVARLRGQLQAPVLLLNGRSPYAASVSVDDRLGAELVTRHLLQLGHKSLLMFTNTLRETPHYSIGERIHGFVDTVGKHGPPDATPHCFEGDAEAFADAWPRLNPVPTAVVCYSHVEAVLALRVLRRAGAKVPHDVSLATFNDVFPVAELEPSLTCVSVPAQEMGRKGAEVLLGLLNGSEPAEKDLNLTFDPTLIQRESTCPIKT